MSVLDVRHLNVRIPTEDGVIHAVRDVSFSVDSGDFFGIVGESGSGKSVLVQAIMGLIPGARITGEVWFDGHDLLTMKPDALRKIRGRAISMIFQDPLSSLHPQFTIGWQIVEQIRTHRKVSRAEARRMTVEILGKVGIPDPDTRFSAYPHQFSGGMRQRVMIAMALVLNPALIIADEPTTALDSTVQAQILDLLHEMREEFDATILMITHDLTVLARVADNMMVMYAGHKLEAGPARELFARPAHPYTSGLLRSSPGNYEPGTPLVPIPGKPPSLLNPVTGCVFAPRCPDAMSKCWSETPPLRTYSNGLETSCWLTEAPSEPEASEEMQDVSTLPITVLNPNTTELATPIVQINDLELSFRSKRGRTSVDVLRGIDLAIFRGETLGLVGESGCGKSTLARVIAGLIPATGGKVHLAGHDLSTVNHEQWRSLRREVQLVFQDPYGSLNPRRRVGSIIGDPFRIHRISSGEKRKKSVQQLMELVGLNPEHYNRFPSQFSGGQRQRIGIARALALNPSIIIYDEPVSALDVSIQAQVLNLMSSLQKEFNLTYLFISHDLAVVRHVCDRIAVMDKGKIVELAATEQLYADPQHDFTKVLLEASAPEEKPQSRAFPELLSTVHAGDLTAGDLIAGGVR
ncbi:ABC transporter ATP-binding protein [Homoserinimonas sp. OAct 916]|uniref:dipeptide ABC transporter ATP-binding protein n=1 Tax=Homoserinimonas sp. OAct 916 TaxID=2211450 RepID=UPI000DBE0662|nr:ABC transporter ATP-binding protein [Homoserinimonas sp. OAct 916]